MPFRVVKTLFEAAFSSVLRGQSWQVDLQTSQFATETAYSKYLVTQIILQDTKLLAWTQDIPERTRDVVLSQHIICVSH